MKTFTLEIEQEEDGRWIAEIPELLGVLSYGATRGEAIAKAEALALRVLADRLEHGEEVPSLKSFQNCRATASVAPIDESGQAKRPPYNRVGGKLLPSA